MTAAWSLLVRSVPLPAIASVLTFLTVGTIMRRSFDGSIIDVSEAELSAVLDFLVTQGLASETPDGSVVPVPVRFDETMCLARISSLLMQPFLINEPLSSSGQRMMKNLDPNSEPRQSSAAMQRASETERMLTEALGSTEAAERVARVYSPAWLALAISRDYEDARTIAVESAQRWRASRREDMRLLFKLAAEAITVRIANSALVIGAEGQALEDEINELVRRSATLETFSSFSLEESISV